MCLKMNYALDREVQDYTYYPAFIEINDDDKILIQNINPDDNSTSRISKFKKSSCSCHVDEIQGIIFGGISSRFWMLRKHINSLIDVSLLKNFPF
jgi:hypothetical protein